MIEYVISYFRYESIREKITGIDRAVRENGKVDGYLLGYLSTWLPLLKNDIDSAQKQIRSP